MSDSSAIEQPPVVTDQEETIAIMELEPPAALPPPPEEEWVPVPESIDMRASRSTFALFWTISVVLGIFSLVLLTLCGFFASQYFQNLQASESKLKSFNEWMEAFQRKAEAFIDIQKGLDYNKATIERLQNQSEDLTEALQALTTNKGRCGHPLSHWIEYRGNCYQQTVDPVSWLNCSDHCARLNATFLKKESSRGLLNFLKLLAVNRTWVGLSYNKEKKTWMWEDDYLPPGL
ncbi:killer cell lectin-like receptor 3 [Echinops telfairi]|uniref:Killer cell lectin-like receptor 3 n=1 Tax=Echinops telfairi TaxID=9371 RepID=A0ABM0J9B2_ECHTE|nr:killer cell lectin-like receptor 3 [Echinops telfairi]